VLNLFPGSRLSRTVPENRTSTRESYGCQPPARSHQFPGGAQQTWCGSHPLVACRHCARGAGRVRARTVPSARWFLPGWAASGCHPIPGASHRGL